MTKSQSLFRRLRWLACFCVGLATLCIAGCGRPGNLVLVTVEGLDSTITELHVTMTLDGTAAKNSQPTVDDGSDPNSFSVYMDMQEFGIDVPSGTQNLGVTIQGLNTSRVVVKTATAQVNLNQTNNLDVTLH